MRRLVLAGIAAAAIACTGCATGITGNPGTVSDTTAGLSGTVLTNSGGEVEYWIEYGTTNSYGSETTHKTVPADANQSRGVFDTLTGLTRDTTYHYRFCARDSSQQGGPGCGEDKTVKTQSFACGETVTESVHFTGDVQCQEANSPGIVVGASGIVIDMNGFDLRSGPVVLGESGVGIDNSSGFADVTIRDGFIGGTVPDLFGPAVRLEDASRNRIVGVRVFSFRDGIEIRGGADNEVRHANLTATRHALVAENTRGLVVADSVSDSVFGDGLRFSNLIDGRVVRNEPRSAGSGGADPRFGIYVAGNGNVIKANLVTGWTGANILLASGGANKLLENEVRGGFLPSNETFDAEGDGLFVNAFTAGTIVRGNHAHDNEGDGIEVQGVQTRITDNTADANGDFGIDAVAGVTDGGGNTASGNGNPLECRNVFCL